MEQAYEEVRWRLPDTFDSYEAFVHAVRHLDMTSSPGIPYMREATTNGQWLKWDGVTMCDMQLTRLWYDVKRVLADDWETVLRVFIKQEPHKMKKVEERRWRLIMACPLSVQVAWQMLFGFMNDLEITKAFDIPSQQGLILVNGGWKCYKRLWDSKGLDHGLDKEAWDWTVPFWIFKADLDFRHRMGRGGRMQEWRNIAEHLYRHMFEDPILQLSSGERFQQEVPGIMKSGCVNTISTNSHGQIMGHLAVCFRAGCDPYPLPVACGDDTIQHVSHTVDLDLYELFGIRVKSVSDTLEFVGHDFPSEGPRPLYLLKHLYKIPYVKEEDMANYLDSMARMYCHTHYFEFWEKLAEALGVELRLSKTSYQFWYDFEE